MTKLIVNPEELKKYYADQRVWQGIPSVEVTKNGRIFVTFYSGGVREGLGNYCMVVTSEDGVNFTEPVLVAISEGRRCFDPCLWIDPLERLWFTWSQCPDDGCYASICENPDAEELVWSAPFFVGNNIMMNKPTVLSTGEWLFPLAVWREGVRLPVLPLSYDYRVEPRMSRVYSTADNGKTFRMLGASDVDDRSFDEHQVLEMKDGSLNMYVRTYYGIALSKSYDGGKNWTKGGDSGIKSPSSRFHIRRLPSGRILLINHVDFDGRNNLSALLSEDEGKTWPYKLLLDERQFVSYPDVALGADGSIYVVYDRERGDAKECLEEATEKAREILLAKITEEEIINGSICNEDSFLKRIVSKLGKYAGSNSNPFFETALFSDRELANYLITKHHGKEEILHEVFERFYKECQEMCYGDIVKMDLLLEEFNVTPGNGEAALIEIIKTIRNGEKQVRTRNASLLEQIVRYIDDHMMHHTDLNQLSKYLSISTYYMMFLIEKECSTSIFELIRYRRKLNNK